jgi:hypothetical protein
VSNLELAELSRRGRSADATISHAPVRFFTNSVNVSPDICRRSLDDHPHVTTGQIHHPTGHVEPPRDLSGRVPETNALHAA